MNTLLKGIGLVLALVAGSAQAIPTLYFDGNVKFNSGTLGVNATLTATDDVNPAPALTGSQFTLSATYLNTTSPNPYITAGHFGNGNMVITDNSANTLLRGSFSELIMKGVNSLDSGLLTGTFNAIDGSLANKFNTGNLFALTFNLSTPFSQGMFDGQSTKVFGNNDYNYPSNASFGGNIDGQISGQNVSVPEPGILALLTLGVVLIGFTRKSGGYTGRYSDVSC